ncbi:MAG: hypothetical protein M1819_007376 [Sarea resinae]|nr:MAG: hypothetical protein M1819_007376 [Sarea resinae]
MSKPFSNVPAAAAINPSEFQVHVSDEQLSELETLVRLSKIAPTTYQNLQKDSNFGISKEWLIEAKVHWEKKFNWRACEERINSFPHFTTPIRDTDGEEYNIHFVALFSDKKDAIPVMLLHGWPGSFLEFLPLLSLIKEQYSPATLPYHFIVPSLPGYAFSSGPSLHKEFHNTDIARLMNHLITDLGLGGGYVVQGGDIGSRVARILAVSYEGCKAAHLNYCNMPEAPPGVTEDSLNELEKKGLERAEWFKNMGSAYAIEHATRPSTIGLVLSTNPVALLAWIGEKFLDWTDKDPPLDTILESVSLYWLTETFPRAIYPYRAERVVTNDGMGAHSDPKWHISKPFGFSWFPNEIPPMPQKWVATTGDLVFWRQHAEVRKSLAFL